MGHTVPEIELAKFDIKPHEKTCFSMVIPDLMAELNAAQPDTKSIVLCGIETHACIHHTTLDLLEKGYQVDFEVYGMRNNSLSIALKFLFIFSCCFTYFLRY